MSNNSNQQAIIATVPTQKNILEIINDPECEDPVCGYATNDFTYSADGEEIYAKIDFRKCKKPNK